MRSDPKGLRRESVESASGRESYQLVLPSWDESFARLGLELGLELGLGFRSRT